MISKRKWRSTRLILRGNCEAPHCSAGVVFMLTAPYQSEKADQRYAFDSLRARWDCLHCSWVSVPAQLPKTSPSPHTGDPPQEIPTCTRSRVITCWPGRPWIICKKQLEKRPFPCHNLINTLHLSCGKPAVTWEGAFLSPGNYCLFGGLEWHGREKGDFKISSNFIAHKTLSAHAVTV